MAKMYNAISFRLLSPDSLIISTNQSPRSSLPTPDKPRPWPRRSPTAPAPRSYARPQPEPACRGSLPPGRGDDATPRGTYYLPPHKSPPTTGREGTQPSPPYPHADAQARQCRASTHSTYAAKYQPPNFEDHGSCEDAATPLQTPGGRQGKYCRRFYSYLNYHAAVRRNHMELQNLALSNCHYPRLEEYGGRFIRLSVKAATLLSPP